MDPLVRRLLAQAQLFDDPTAYEAGVRDAVEALETGSEDAGTPVAATGSARERLAV